MKRSGRTPASTVSLALTSALVAAGLGAGLAAPAAAGPTAPAAPVPAAVSPSATPLPNPNLPRACGIDILVVLDESRSVAPYTAAVRQAYNAFTQSLKNTGSRLAVAEFSEVADLPLTGNARTAYTVVTDQTIASTFRPYITSGYNPSGAGTSGTNWEDGFRVASYQLPRPSLTQPHLVVFITDGAPNKIIKDTVSSSDYQTQVPLSTSQITAARDDAAANRAVPNANALKSQGSHVLALAVGAGLSGSSNLDRLIKVSGPDVYSGSGTFDISTTDVYRESNFNRLEEALRAAAFQLCSPSITVRKLVDDTPDPNTPGDAVPGPGYDLKVVADPPPSRWILPATATGDTATVTTGGDGFATFQWETPAPTTSSAQVTEATPPPGYRFNPDRTTCTYRTPDQPDDTPLPTTDLNLGFSTQIPQDAIVTCSIVNEALPAPAMTIQKSTDGQDADTAPGPRIPEGATVTWRYVVTNTGNTTLSGLSVGDDPGDPGDPTPTVSCPVTTLAPGARTTCTATGTARAGQYENTATATATDSFGTPVGPVQDPSHYVGAAPSVDLEKLTNDQDADTAPGPFVAVGGQVTWTYVVTNTGNEALGGITVTDDHLGDNYTGSLSCPSTSLAIGASMTCTATGTAAAGQYANQASVSATASTSGRTVGDSDLSHYFGAQPSVSLEKLTNGEDADTGTGPSIPLGDPVDWTYVVTNTGNVPLTTWDVVDDPDDPGDPAPGVTCPDTTLLPGASASCLASGTARAGQYGNTATVTASSTAVPGQVTATDPSHYFGADPGIDIEKATNGQDADAAPGPYVAPGSTVSWTYVVTNTGNQPLANVVVTDDQGVVVTCPSTTLPDPPLAPGASITCTASGTAVTGQYANVGTVTADPPSGAPVTDDDPSHYFGAEPALRVEKLTNAQDADTGTGPYVPVGDVVLWVYGVKNEGNVPLTDVDVADSDLGVQVVCQDIAALLPGQIMICLAVGTADPDQYSNVATATARDPNGNPVTPANDPSHYFGSRPRITVEKSTNGFDADLAPSIPGSDAPYVAVGGTVTWTYQVTNTGNTDLGEVSVFDDQPGVVPSCPKTALLIGESMTCTATGVATPGAYANLGTANGVSVPLGTVVTDDDPSHYFGSQPAVDVEKATNGQDADTPTGPLIASGDPVQWSYLVTNTGNVPLPTWDVADDPDAPTDPTPAVSCPDTTLLPGASATCLATGTARAGQYANTATVSAADRDGNPATPATDPSHYFGSVSSIDIEKTTNGQDADAAPGPFIPVGAPVTWAYVVTNTGNTVLTGVAVTDTLEGSITCPVTTLPPGASTSCTAGGTAALGAYTNSATVVATDPLLKRVVDIDPSNYFGYSSQILVEKSTNGDDADDAPGVAVPVGGPVTWTYVVTNPSNVRLVDISVTDDREGPVTCPATALDPGASMTCTGSTSTAQAGLYANVATATGRPEQGQEPVTDTDPSHYTGYTSSVDVEKSTNGQDADAPPGPAIAVGGAVSWAYVVTNTGTSRLLNVTVTDSDPSVAVTCPTTQLDPGESTTCTAGGTSRAGQYQNTGTVDALDQFETPVSDADPSHYFGAATGIDVEKATNGQDADVAPGPSIDVGDPVTWTYVVTNTGNSALTQVAVTDDRVGAVTCPAGQLAPGAAMTCTATGTAVAGQYANLGTVTARDTATGGTVADSDPSHYYGVPVDVAGCTTGRQVPVRPNTIRKRNGVAVIRAGDTCAGQPIRVRVRCVPIRGLLPGGDTAACRVTGSRTTPLRVRNVGSSPVRVRVVYSAPRTAEYRAYHDTDVIRLRPRRD